MDRAMILVTVVDRVHVDGRRDLVDDPFDDAHRRIARADIGVFQILQAQPG